MRRLLLYIALFCSLAWCLPARAEITVRVKDISHLEGLRENQIFGFGLVVGLQGSGDSRIMLTRSTLKNLLKNLGLQNEEDIRSKNAAAVLLTAKLPPFVRVGDKIDVTVSSLGDAKSLDGGILIQSPLKGADDRIYAVAQGPLTLGDSGRGRGRNSVKTVARIIGGGIVERAIDPEYVVKNNITLVLDRWDFFEVDQILKALTEKYPDLKHAIEKGGKIKIALPKDGNLAEFVSAIENIEIVPADRARVVVNEKDGTIVMGGNVKISEAVVSKEGLLIKVEGSSEKLHVAQLKESSTVKDLVDSLNFIGASTRDIIAILKALKDAGALHAELIVR